FIPSLRWEYDVLRQTHDRESDCLSCPRHVKENRYANLSCSTVLRHRVRRVRRVRHPGGREGGPREGGQEIPGHLDIRVQRSGRQEASDRRAEGPHPYF